MSEPQDEIQPPRRTFPPLYIMTGSPEESLITEMYYRPKSELAGLTIKSPTRKDHMYRMAVLALCSSDVKLDIAKCVMLCVVHDLAEAQVGDIAPREGISKSEKQRLEEEAMQNFVHDMLHNSPAAQRIEALWKEYENQQTEEARFVKDLDRFEMALQASDYEIRDKTETLQGFFENSLPLIRHPEVKSWANDLEIERQQRSQK